MDIKSIAKPIRKRVEALSKRERLIGIVILVGLVVGAPYLFMYQPAAKKATVRQQMLQTLNKEVETLNVALSSQNAFQQSQTDEAIKLPEVEDLSGMLAAISREASMARVDFISIAPEGFEYKDKFIIMKVKIELRVRFRELYDFLKNLELRHGLFLIQEIKFETNSVLYPSGIAILKAVTYLRKKK